MAPKPWIYVAGRSQTIPSNQNDLVPVRLSAQHVELFFPLFPEEIISGYLHNKAFGQEGLNLM